MLVRLWLQMWVRTVVVKEKHHHGGVVVAFGTVAF